MEENGCREAETWLWPDGYGYHAVLTFSKCSLSDHAHKEFWSDISIIKLSSTTLFTLLQTPKGTKATHMQNLHQTRERERRHMKTTCLCTHEGSAVFTFFGVCTYRDVARTFTHTPAHWRQEWEEQIKENVVKKTNTQGQPPPHKQGISLPKTKRPEQPTHIQRNGRRGGRVGGSSEGEGESENMLRGQKGRAKSFITVITTWAHLLFHSPGGAERRERGRAEIKLAHRGVYHPPGDNSSYTVSFKWAPITHTHKRITEEAHTQHTLQGLLNRPEHCGWMKRAMKGPSKCLHRSICFTSLPLPESRCPSPPRCTHYTSKAEQCLTTI